MDSVRLNAVIIGDGVNALKPGSQIDFASGVTVVFGENGSGNSGLVRGLKRAVGIRTAEDILRNVHAGVRFVGLKIILLDTTGTMAKNDRWSSLFTGDARSSTTGRIIRVKGGTSTPPSKRKIAKARFETNLEWLRTRDDQLLIDVGLFPPK